jgi:predicted nicotinamide N-methyase
VALPSDLIEDIVCLGDHDVALARPRDAEALVDEESFREDERLPYWAELWPSAELLARTVAGRALRNRRVLELGCGLGLPSLAAALAGGRVTASDWAPDAIEAVRENARRNDLVVEALVCSWQEPAALVARAPWDVVLAADVVYERRNVALLLDLLPRLGGEVWLADPGRAWCDALLEQAEAAGWTRGVLATSRRPEVTVHRLRAS